MADIEGKTPKDKQFVGIYPGFQVGSITFGGGYLPCGCLKTPGYTINRTSTTSVWIKFSEEKPEKEGRYLCYDSALDGKLYVMDWHDGEFFNPFEDHDRYCAYQGTDEPDYWAEIMLPE